ncbi:hypothetical protein PIROE2DRAFT_57528 [Piromyces sp. E2]|nr:hypothetical protein PIROE2DRAFT_57528 [Piromyces sp. E2]|eukprot:OUM69324.1 hypothetical protein PIROE2DRAFT_57528 [Piromyces sp. E2]
MFFPWKNIEDRYEICETVIRNVSDEEEEECLESYEKGMAIGNDTIHLKHAIIGRDKKYEALVQDGIEQAIHGGHVNFKMIYERAVFQDIFATVGYRFELLKKYDEAYFWLRVAAVGNSNYLQDAQRVKNVYDYQKK